LLKKMAKNLESYLLFYCGEVYKHGM
jgi:hypothetical protein